MVSIYKRGRILYLQFVVDGKRRQKSTGLEDTPANRRLLKKEVIPLLEIKIATGEFSRQKPKNFEWYADKYLLQKENLKTYWEVHNIVVNQLTPFFKDMNTDQVKRGHIKDFAEMKLKKGVSSKTIRKILNILVAIFDIAIDYEHIQANPAIKIKLPKHVPKRIMKPFTKNEVNILMENAEGWFKNLLAFSFYTGARPGEIIALTWSDIDLYEKVININKRIKKGIIDTPKTKSSIRKVPIFENLIPFIEDQKRRCKEVGSMTVFFNPYTKKVFYDSKKIVSHWYKLLEKCGFEKRAFYNTRHTFVTQMIRSGVSILDVSQMVGHKTIEETISTYAKYLPEEHLKINREIDPFSCRNTDTQKSKPYFKGI